MFMVLISRMAPTPSGYLHLGNVLNFVLTWWSVKVKQGVLWLRIDDVDDSRVRPEFIEDIFSTLDWLGFDWQRGPSSPREFQQHFSQQRRQQIYWQQLEKLKDRFTCRCSRKDISALSSLGLYAGTCRDQNYEFQAKQNTLRLKTPPGELYDLMSDFIIWRKDNMASYQLASVVDDEEFQINTIIRGQDLWASTMAQKHLAKQLGFSSFLKADIYHHALISDHLGEKLSKSIPSHSLHSLREAGTSSAAVLQNIAFHLGYKNSKIEKLEHFLDLDLSSQIGNEI